MVLISIPGLAMPVMSASFSARKVRLVWSRDGFPCEVNPLSTEKLSGRMCLISFTAEQVSGVRTAHGVCSELPGSPRVPTNFSETWVWLCWAAISQGKTHPPNLREPPWLV